MLCGGGQTSCRLPQNGYAGRSQTNQEAAVVITGSRGPPPGSRANQRYQHQSPLIDRPGKGSDIQTWRLIVGKSVEQLSCVLGRGIGLNVCHQQSVLASFFFVTVQTKRSENGRAAKRVETGRDSDDVTANFVLND